MSDADLIVYEFSRSKVEYGDFRHFLGLYGLDKLPTGQRLREMMNRVVFRVEGGGSGAHQILMMPEIRRFYSLFHEAWPHWLYFCNLRLDALRAMTMCCLPSIDTMHVDGQDHMVVSCESVAIQNFLKRDFLLMARMCRRAEMSEDQAHDRREAVFEYFELPFDVEPSDPAARQ